jgi:hypothetical protein
MGGHSTKDSGKLAGTDKIQDRVGVDVPEDKWNIVVRMGAEMAREAAIGVNAGRGTDSIVRFRRRESEWALGFIKKIDVHWPARNGLNHQRIQ